MLDRTDSFCLAALLSGGDLLFACQVGQGCRQEDRKIRELSDLYLSWQLREEGAGAQFPHLGPVIQFYDVEENSEGP